MRLVFQEADPAGFDALRKAVLKFRSTCLPERKAQVAWLCGQIQADCADYSGSIESHQAGRTVDIGRNDYFTYEANSRHLRASLLLAGRWREFSMESSRSLQEATRNGAQFFLDILKLQQAFLCMECFDHDSIPEMVKDIHPVRDFIGHKLAVLKAMVYVRTNQGELALRTAADGLKIGGGCIEFRQRLALERARIEALLLNRNLAEALSALNAYQRFVHSTLERTYHALTWELLARIHLAKHDPNAACDAIEAGLEIIREHDLPLADWKISATASVVFHALGRRTDAGHQRNLGLAAIRRLSAELDVTPQLMEKFETGAIQCLSPANAVLGVSGA